MPRGDTLPPGKDKTKGTCKKCHRSLYEVRPDVYQCINEKCEYFGIKPNTQGGKVTTHAKRHL